MWRSKVCTAHCHSCVYLFFSVVVFFFLFQTQIAKTFHKPQIEILIPYVRVLQFSISHFLFCSMAYVFPSHLQFVLWLRVVVSVFFALFWQRKKNMSSVSCFSIEYYFTQFSLYINGTQGVSKRNERKKKIRFQVDQRKKSKQYANKCIYINVQNVENSFISSPPRCFSQKRFSSLATFAFKCVCFHFSFFYSTSLLFSFSIRISLRRFLLWYY